MYDQKSVFFFGGSVERTAVTAGARIVAADMQLFRVYFNAFLTKNCNAHIAVSLLLQFVWQASSKDTRYLAIKTNSLGLKKCAFTCDLTFFSTLACNATLCRHNELSALPIDSFDSLPLEYSVFLQSAIPARPVLLLREEDAKICLLRLVILTSLKGLTGIQKEEAGVPVRSGGWAPILMYFTRIFVVFFRRLVLMATFLMLFPFVFVTGRW